MSDLRRRLERLEGEPLLVVADSSRDPDMGPFVGSAHLGSCFFLAHSGSGWLGYATDMERDEAAGTGWNLLAPEALRWRSLRDESSPGLALGRVLERALEVAGLRPGELPVAGRTAAGPLWEALQYLEGAGWSIASGAPAVQRLRKAKTEQELAVVREGCTALGRAFREIARTLDASSERDGELWRGGERLRAGHLRGAVTRRLAEAGWEQPLGNIVTVGADCAVPHSQGHSRQVLGANQTILVDLFPAQRLFVDCTRTFLVSGDAGRSGGARAAATRAHHAVIEALGTAEARATVGLMGKALNDAVADQLEERGYETVRSTPGTQIGFVHGLGHGVGYEIHEGPDFRASDSAMGSLELGDVFAMEPGLYHPGEGWGVRVENLYTMTDEGIENLTPWPVTLNPKEWPA